jgi:glycosyltransferase involved in cell wall biosynthesis
VLSQTYSNWEYVIVDNSSTDATPEILRELAAAEPRIRVYRNERTVNVLQNHNIGVSHISPSSPYCKILHADDRLLPECLEKMIGLAELHPTIGIVGALSYWGSKIFGEGLPRERSFFAGKEAARRTLLGETYPFLSPSCLLLRTAALSERKHFYDEQVLHTDVQLCYEVLSKWDFGFLHEPLTVVQAHADSVTSKAVLPMQRLLASNLDLLATYGPLFLSPRELGSRMDERIADYYEKLAASAFDWRGMEFWRFHREALAKAGHRMSAGRMLQTVLSMFVASPVTRARQLARGALRQLSANT